MKSEVKFFFTSFLIFCVTLLIFPGFFPSKLGRPEIEIVTPPTIYEVLSKEYRWYNKRYHNIITYYCKRYEVSPFLVAALVQKESWGKARAKGPWVTVNVRGRKVKTRAYGLMQIIPEFHWEGRPLWKLRKPKNNLRVGIKYLAWCLKRGGGLTTGLKNYNSGPGSKYYNRPYIKDITARYKRTRNRTI